MPRPRLSAAQVVVLVALAGCVGTKAPPEPAEPEAPAAAAPEASEFGTVHFETSCESSVQGELDDAVALLHHMMYEGARERFEAVAEEDPSCAMAHWGVAMTLFQPLWPSRPSAQDLERGRQEVAAARALETTEREQAWIDAVAAFYESPDADWWTRLASWEEGMERVQQGWPDDLDAAAFLALAHLATGQVADDRMAHHERAAKILRAVYEIEPRHPGAVHYTIHADDVDGRADESLDIVRSYGEIAPSVPHALHMPTHIYVRLGDWPEVIAWNERSAEAALEHPADGAVSHHYPHAMGYLLYAHLQRGDDARARAVLDEVDATLAQAPPQSSFISAFHLASMPARYALERGDWAAAAALEPRMHPELAWDDYPWPDGITWAAKGIGAARSGDLELARQAASRLEALEGRAEELGEPGWAAQLAVDRNLVLGTIAHAEGDDDEALVRLREAAEREATLQKPPVTPGALVPPYEALGEVLLDLDRPAEAQQAYETSLARWPRRFNGLLGAARAARAAGDTAAAKAYYGELLEVAAPDSDRTAALDEAREYVETEGA